MILVFDIGNTNIKLGAFENERLAGTWRIATDLRKTSDEYGIAIVAMLSAANIKVEEIDGIVVSSVVPGINFTIEHMISDYLKKKPLIVGAGIKTGLNIKIDSPRELGGDIICDAVSAFRRYGGPCITMDFGTATTTGVISENGEFLGGCICAGVKVSSDALSDKAAKLPSVALELPESVIGKNTIESMRSGVVYGTAGMIDSLVERMEAEIGEATVVATGGSSLPILKSCRREIVFNNHLVLLGLQDIYYKNLK